MAIGIFIKMELLIIAIPVWHYIQEIGGMLKTVKLTLMQIH